MPSSKLGSPERAGVFGKFSGSELRYYYDLKVATELGSIEGARKYVLLPTGANTAELQLFYPLGDTDGFVYLSASNPDVFDVFFGYFNDYLAAVGFLHSRGVFVGDAKPENCLRLGGKWYLIDFSGLYFARPRDESLLRTNGSRFQTSWHYFPPHLKTRDRLLLTPPTVELIDSWSSAVHLLLAAVHLWQLTPRGLPYWATGHSNKVVDVQFLIDPIRQGATSGVVLHQLESYLPVELDTTLAWRFYDLLMRPSMEKVAAVHSLCKQIILTHISAGEYLGQC